MGSLHARYQRGSKYKCKFTLPFALDSAHLLYSLIQAVSATQQQTCHLQHCTRLMMLQIWKCCWGQIKLIWCGKRFAAERALKPLNGTVCTPGDVTMPYIYAFKSYTSPHNLRVFLFCRRLEFLPCTIPDHILPARQQLCKPLRHLIFFLNVQEPGVPKHGCLQVPCLETILEFLQYSM